MINGGVYLRTTSDIIRVCSGLLVVSELASKIRALLLRVNNIPMSVVIEFLKLIANYTLNERFIASKKNIADKKGMSITSSSQKHRLIQNAKCRCFITEIIRSIERT